MSGDFARPVRRASGVFDGFVGSQDPAARAQFASDSAHTLLARTRANPSTAVVEQLCEFVPDNGLSPLAELWGDASAHSLAGALWRVFLLHTVMINDTELQVRALVRGVESSRGIDPFVVGATGEHDPAELRALANDLLRGVFCGDLATALDRAAAYAALCASGLTSLADDADLSSSAIGDATRSAELAARALRHLDIAHDLRACAKLERAGNLE